MSFPFVDIRDVFDKSKFTRTFKKNVKLDELVWHRDRKDREFMVMEGVGWKLQMDNELPSELEVGRVYNIQKGKYHRLMKGNSDLKLEIREYE
tara:strand:- start:1316 stop:1594 length:279 start_codon:yes stop_codon:yes gene_type:complete